MNVSELNIMTHFAQVRVVATGGSLDRKNVHQGAGPRDQPAALLIGS
jgi:hypothetical protein